MSYSFRLATGEVSVPSHQPSILKVCGLGAKKTDTSKAPTSSGPKMAAGTGGRTSCSLTGCQPRTSSNDGATLCKIQPEPSVIARRRMLTLPCSPGGPLVSTRLAISLVLRSERKGKPIQVSHPSGFFARSAECIHQRWVRPMRCVGLIALKLFSRKPTKAGGIPFRAPAATMSFSLAMRANATTPSSKPKK